MAGERKASDPRCVHGSWQGTYCPDCPANRAVFGAQRFLPSLTPPGERPERDVLAEALSDLVSGRTTGHERGVAWVRYGAYAGDGLTADQALAGPIIVALSARGYTLSKSAPDRLCAAELDRLRAVVKDAVWELRHRKPNVSDADIAGVLERAALSPDRPTPP